MNDNLSKGGIRRYLDSVTPEEYYPTYGEVDLSELSLTGLADLFGSDKGSLKHNYCKEYEFIVSDLLRGADRKTTSLKICEAGVACGSSLKMWASYLPNSNIYGFDIRRDCLNVCKEVKNIQIVIDNLCEQPLKFNVDLFIDDASHISEYIVSMFVNNWSKINPRGYYVIEDLNCTYNESYTHSFNAGFADAIPNDRRVFMNLIDALMRDVDVSKSIDFFRYTSKLLIIKKR